MSGMIIQQLDRAIKLYYDMRDWDGWQRCFILRSSKLGKACKEAAIC